MTECATTCAAASLSFFTIACACQGKQLSLLIMRQFFASLIKHYPNGAKGLTGKGLLYLALAVCLLNGIIFYFITGPNFALHK